MTTSAQDTAAWLAEGFALIEADNWCHGQDAALCRAEILKTNPAQAVDSDADDVIGQLPAASNQLLRIKRTDHL
jgi:hypothetical protein